MLIIYYYESIDIMKTMHWKLATLLQVVISQRFFRCQDSTSFPKITISFYSLNLSLEGFSMGLEEDESIGLVGELGIRTPRCWIIWVIDRLCFLPSLTV